MDIRKYTAGNELLEKEMKSVQRLASRRGQSVKWIAGNSVTLDRVSVLKGMGYDGFVTIYNRKPTGSRIFRFISKRNDGTADSELYVEQNESENDDRGEETRADDGRGSSRDSKAKREDVRRAFIFGGNESQEESGTDFITKAREAGYRV